MSSQRAAVGGWVALLLLAHSLFLALREWVGWNGWLITTVLVAIGMGFWVAVVAWIVLRVRERRAIEGMSPKDVVAPWFWPIVVTIVLAGALITITTFVG